MKAALPALLAWFGRPRLENNRIFEKDRGGSIFRVFFCSGMFWVLGLGLWSMVYEKNYSYTSLIVYDEIKGEAEMVRQEVTRVVIVTIIIIIITVFEYRPSGLVSN